MDTVEHLALNSAAGALKHMLDKAERALSQIQTRNGDKPVDLETTTIVPRTRLNFPSGRGVSDADPLRLNPSTQTPFTIVRPDNSVPETTIDIARIWGVRSAFSWSVSHSMGTELFAMQVDPVTRDYASTYKGNPTPMEYVTSMYMFRSGTIDLRFKFVPTAFHSGAISVSTEFSRPVAGDAGNYNAVMNTYTKTFQPGDQRSFEFTIPCIYDTTFLRCTKLPFNPMLLDQDGSRENVNAAVGTYTEVRTKVRVRVVNELKPIPSAPQSIIQPI